MSIKRPKGTQDHLPVGSPQLKLSTSASGFAFIRETAKRVLERAGAHYIDTPMFEEAELIKRGVGGTTDIVQKEMFTVHYFGDHGGYILRPEATAGIMRAYLQNGWKQFPTPLKLWLHGSMFRAENVQAGRLREFHQIDYEVIGSAEALVDAEAIALMTGVIRDLGLKNIKVKIGSIGDTEDRISYNAYLKELFSPHQERLSSDSQNRLARNPMRILDSKSESDKQLIAELDIKPMLNFLGDESRAHFEEVQKYLQDWGISYEVDPSIVRGLDYYRRTAWEIHHEGVGAKSALGGGGRYDGLAEDLGGPAVPAIGWAFGIERLLLAMETEGVEIPPATGMLLYMVALDEKSIPYIAKLANQARAFARVEFAYKAVKIPNAFKDAQRRGAKYIAIVGSEELASQVLGIKDMQTGEQFKIKIAELPSFLQKGDS